MVRVLVVDDSAFARKVVREMLTSAGFEVVGIARDGLEALEKIAELKPDVVTLDLVMPNLDGLGVLAALPAEGAPRVVVVSLAGEETALGLAALQAGAVEIVRKPTALAVERLREISAELERAVRAAGQARAPSPAETPSPASPRPMRDREAVTKKILVVGASTGGPQAVARLLRELPPDLPVPVAIVVHLPPGYTEAFARRLDDESGLEVLEASEGLELRAGRAVVARAGHHLKLRTVGSSLRAALDGAPAQLLHRPAVDVLFASAADQLGRRVLGVVLTGMGDDGTAGARAIRQAGGEVLTEAESSCVVYGMPRCVDEAGLATATVPLAGMVDLVLRHL